MPVHEGVKGPHILIWGGLLLVIEHLTANWVPGRAYGVARTRPAGGVSSAWGVLALSSARQEVSQQR